MSRPYDQINGPNAPSDHGKKTYELNFAGLTYKLKSSHDQATVQELAQIVDQKLQQALSTLKSGSYQSAAVLAALNIAEELITLRRNAIEALDRLENRTQRLLDAQAKVRPQLKGTPHEPGSDEDKSTQAF